MALKLADLQVTNHSFPITSAVFGILANNDGLVVIGTYDSSKNSTVATTASVFAPGCILFNKAGSSASTALVGNTGSTASPTWTVFTIS